MAVKGCCACIRYLVIFLNVLFWLVGIAVLVLSIWVLVDSGLHKVNTSETDYKLGIYILIGAGSLMTVVGGLGCIGAIKESPCLLGTFFVLLVVIFSGYVAAGIWSHINRDEVLNMVELVLQNTIKTGYKCSEQIKEAVDRLQSEWHCCGAINPADYKDSKCTKNGSDMETVKFGAGTRGGSYKVPKSCCKSVKEAICNHKREQVIGGSFTKEIYTEGCSPMLQDAIVKNRPMIIGMYVAVGLVQVLGMIFSLSLCLGIICMDRQGKSNY